MGDKYRTWGTKCISERSIGKALGRLTWRVTEGECSTLLGRDATGLGLAGSDQFDVSTGSRDIGGWRGACVQLKVRGQCNASVSRIHGWHEVNVTEAG